MAGTFTVYVGAQPYLDCSNPHQLSLVIDADVNKLREASSKHASWGVLQRLKVVETVIGPVNEGSIHWYEYNDARFDGVLPQDAWQDIYPNVKTIRQQQRTTRSLFSLLDEWVLHDGHTLTKGTLVLSQGDYQKTLQSLAHWESVFTSISILGPSADRIWSPRLLPWMHEHGFSQEPMSLWWQRDETARLTTENEQLRAQIHHAKRVINDLLEYVRQSQHNNSSNTADAEPMSRS